MSKDVKDIDHGWKDITDVVVDLDGANVRSGLLSAKPRYPSKGKTQVAKVGMIHGFAKIMGRVYDANETDIDKKLAKIHRKILKHPERNPYELLADTLAIPLRDLYREAITAEGLVDTGLLRDTIRGTSYASGKWKAGDNPKTSD